MAEVVRTRIGPDHRLPTRRTLEEPLEVVDAGDVVAFLCRIRLRARSSGIELDSHLGQVFWMERGLIVRERDFSDWDEALREVGIPVAAEGSGRQGPVTSAS